MRSNYWLLVLLSASTRAMPSQLVLSQDVQLKPDEHQSEDFLSRWSAQNKQKFLDALEADDADEWVVTIGNEAGDTDSLVSAVAYSYHLTHLKKHPQRSIALLQRRESDLRLRPENDLALAYSHMKHEDLLTLSDLSMSRSELASRVGGLVLLDHNELLSDWGTIGARRVVAVIDHHHDKGLYPHASPRIIEFTESCTTLVARELLHDLHKPVSLPKQLIDLMLHAIALDTSDFKHGHDTLDHQVAHQLLPFSSWSTEKLEEVIKRLDRKMTKAKKDLGHLSVFDLLLRDWKGDIRRAPDSHAVHLGFASVPTSLADMVHRTATKTIDEYFQVESNFTVSIKADASICLTSFNDAQGNKRREIILVVKTLHRLTEALARSLFETISKGIEASPDLQVTVWKGDLGHGFHKRKVWENHGGKKAGRKIVRPIVEKAVEEWLADHPHLRQELLAE